MKELPDKIEYTFKKLREQNDRPLSLKQISGYYYVYIATSTLDPNTKKPMNIQKYLGRILDNGKFIKRRDYELEDYGNASKQFPELIEIDNIDRKILTILSMNGRATLPLMNRLTGLSPTALHHRIKNLEKNYNIQYIAEIDLEKLGYQKFIVLARFVGKKRPSVNEMYKATANIPNIQLVALVKGSYDIVMYILSKENRDVPYTINEILDSGMLNYQIEWYIGNFYETYGFIPLRDIFIDSIKNKLKEREYHLLKELNANGRMEFTEIDKKYSQDLGRSNYAYSGLKENGMLKRITINMLNAPIKYMGIIYLSIFDATKFVRNRKLLLTEISKDPISLINDYLLIGDISIPKGGIFFIPIINEGDLKTYEENFEHMQLGVNVETMVIIKNIIGNFCNRLFDNAYSRQNQLLIEEHNKQRTELINYDETGRQKKVRTPKLDIRGLPIEENQD